MSKLPLYAVTVLALSACQQNRWGGVLPSPTELRAQECTDFPAVVRVDLNQCTGTYITANKVLTASHCIAKVSRPTIYTPWGDFPTRDTVRLGVGKLKDPSDLAIVLTDPVPYLVKNPDTILPFTTSLKLGDVATLVGYAGGRRCGTNVVYERNDFWRILSPIQWAPTRGGRSMLHIDGPSNRAFTMRGDSGSPLLVQRKGKWYVGAVLHAGGIEGNDFFSDYVDLSRPGNREFLERQGRD